MNDPSEALEQLGNRVAEAVHDLRNVAAAISGYSALVTSALDAVHAETGEERWAALSRDVTEIRVATSRIAEIVSRLSAAIPSQDFTDPEPGA